MKEYTINDLKSVLKFGKNNPNSTIDDWFNKNSEELTTDEATFFMNITYSTFNLKIKDKSINFYIFKSNNSNELMQIFINKFAGLKSHYRLMPMPGEFYSPIYYIFTFDKKFGNLKNWKTHDRFKFVKTISNDDVMFLFDLPDSNADELELEQFRYYEIGINKSKIKFWDYESRLMCYLNCDVKFDFKPIDNLFKNVKS